MSFTLGQVRDYCEPFLRRKKFSYNQLNGVLSPTQKKDLGLAYSFAVPGEAASGFMLQLRNASPHLREPIMEEISRLEGKKGLSGDEKREFFQRVRRIFIANGIHTDHGRPGSVGLILKQTEIEGVPACFYLGETSSRSIFPGRLTLPTSDDQGFLLVNVSSAGQRITQVLDMLFSSERDPEDFIERVLVRADPKELEGYVNMLNLDFNTVNVDFVLHIASMRISIDRIAALMDRSDSPADFLLRALNNELDSILSHETAHILEGKANGHLRISKEKKEMLAYLMQAVYSCPEIAVRSIIDRHELDFDDVMPHLVQQVMAMGHDAFSGDVNLLRESARGHLDDHCLMLTGKTHDQLVDTRRLRKVQTSDHITKEHLPLIEKTICNPSK